VKSERTYIPKRLALRWRIDYVGRRPIFGAWSSDKILAKPHSGKPNIREVMIEGSDLVTGEIRILARAPGFEWLAFRWRLAGAIPVGALSHGITEIRMEGAIHGLTLVTQEEMATVFIDGKVKLEPNPDWKKKK